MNRTQFILLVIVAAVVIGFALKLNKEQSGEQQTEAHQGLYADLEGQLNSITRISVHKAGQETVELERQDDLWRIKQKGGYPADVSKLREGLITLAQTELIEEKTKNPGNYAKLGVQDVDKENAESQEVKLWGDDATEPFVSLLIGKTGTGGGNYVRKTGDPQSWLISKAISFPDAITEWLDKTLINLDVKRVRQVELKLSDDTSYTLIKNNASQTDFELTPVAEGTTVKQAEIQRISTTLSGLDLDDVLPADQTPEGLSWNSAVFKTFDGLIIETQSSEQDNKHYLKLTARFDPAEVVVKQDNPTDNEQQAEQTGQDKPADNSAGTPQTEDIQADANKLQQRFEGWTFIIPANKATALHIKLAELTEQPKDANEGDAASGIEGAGDTIESTTENAEDTASGIESSATGDVEDATTGIIEDTTNGMEAPAIGDIEGTANDMEVPATGDVEGTTNGMEAPVTDNAEDAANGMEAPFTDNAEGTANGMEAPFTDNVEGTANGMEALVTDNVEDAANGIEAPFTDNAEDAANGMEAPVTDNVEDAANGMEAPVTDNVEDAANGMEAPFTDNVEGTANGMEEAPVTDNAEGTANGMEAPFTDNVEGTANGMEAPVTDNAEDAANGMEAPFTDNVEGTANGMEVPFTDNVEDTANGMEAPATGNIEGHTE